MLGSLVDGFLFGFSYALIGIGFTLIFGVMQKFNLAHGPTALAGAYLGLAVYRRRSDRLVGLPAVFSFPAQGIRTGAADEQHGHVDPD